MSKKAYKYCHVEATDERPSERTENDIHSEIITLYDTDRDRLEKVAVIHDDQHIGGKVNGIQDMYPYHEKICPCKGGKPPVRAWNGEQVIMIPFNEWAQNPEVPVLDLNDDETGSGQTRTNVMVPLNKFFRTVFEKVGIW